MPDIDCRELIEFLDDYVAGSLDSSRKTSFESHLSQCRACRNYLATYRAAMRLSKGAAHSSTDDIPEDLVRAIMAARTKEQ